MIRISRYRGLAAVLLGLGLSLGLLDLGLTAVVGFTGKFLPDRETPTDDSVFKAVWGKIVRVLPPPKQPATHTAAPLGVLFGQSTLGAGVDAEILGECDGLPLRWANLHGWGGSLNRTRDIAELAFASDLKPDVVLLCVNPYMLVGHDFETEHRLTAEQEHKSFKKWIWTYDNRFVVNHLARHILLRMRFDLLRTFRFGFLSLYAPAGAASGAPQPRQRLTPMTPAQMVDKVEYARNLGWGDASRYSVDTSNSRSLVEIVRESRAAAKVGIILMPEYSLFRRMIPPRAAQCFDEINRAKFPDDPVPIYDLRDRIPDALFFDPDHPSVDAVKPISTLVAACVRDLLSDHPDPKRLSPHGGDAPPR